jgi:co-chaperonin GroES (HSP10)
MNVDIKNIQRFIVVGDRVLIRPESEESRTASGLYLPPGVTEREKIQSGYVIKVGPGYATAAPPEDEIFLRKEAYEIEFDKEKYLIVPHSAILLLIRNEDLFE